MVHINILAFCLASIFILNVVNCEVENNVGSEINSVEFTAVNDVDQFLSENPDAKLLKKVSNIPNAKNQIVYRFGSRNSGDRRVAQRSGGQQWSTNRDFTTTFYYPYNGSGASITYVQLNVDQSSNLGRAYIVAGGIGQRTIKIVVEARQTNYFRYVYTVYGY